LLVDPDNPRFALTEWVDMVARRALEPGYGWLRASDDRLPTVLRARPSLTLLRWAARARPHYAELLASFELTPNQHAILCCLAELGPLFHTNLAERLKLDSGDLVAFLDQLERKLLIFRDTDDHDRRRRESSISQRGRSSLERVERGLDSFEQAVFAGIDSNQRALLIECTARLNPRDF
jgi:DNA-binding MarR family transcriptional regulator